MWANADPQRPFGRSPSRNDDLVLPEARLQAWGQKAKNTGILHSAPLTGTRCGGLVLAFCLLACDDAPCPGRVLALSLSADCYAIYGVQLSSAEFQLCWLVAECITTKACTSLIKGSLSATPCCQSFIGYVKPTAHPPP